MRRLSTTAESGLSRHALEWGERKGQWRRVQRGVYAEGREDPTPLDRERAQVMASGGPARGGLALLETLAVQLVRRAGLPDPVRQLRITTRHGTFVARVDLAWPWLGVFVELDGQGHTDQPVYDASRQTAVVVVTGWRVARFTWTQVTRTPRWCARQLQSLLLEVA